MLLEAIAKRRSIRKFLDIPVTDAQVRELLEAGMLAPTAKNGQPWHFIVVRNPETLQKLRENHPYSTSLQTAPLCICVCGVIDPAMPDYYTQDCAACTQNILLQAAHMDLGACWMGVAPREERMKMAAEILDIPEGIAPFCLIAVGTPAEKREMPTRFNHTRIHMEKF